MAQIGKINQLAIVKQKDFGLYLDGGEYGNILLPQRYVPDNFEIGEHLKVFIYFDSNDEIIATNETPYAMVEECAHLQVKDVNRVGAFLDWGLSKDLLVPFNEQYRTMEVNKHYVVYLYVDESTGRIAASSRIQKYLSEESYYFTPKQAVSLLIYGQTDLGFKAIINNTHLGLLFHGEVFQKLTIGQHVNVYIKNIREDNKIDLCLQLQNQEARDDLSTEIYNYLNSNGGESNITDKSSPAEIAKQFGVSKGSYKRAIGALYKQKRIIIEKDKIRLSHNTHKPAIHKSYNSESK